MKAKVIDVKYRKDSTKFPTWMKYEITLLNEDGSTEKIPAYGKDLQDALSRVVHDTKVEKASKVVNKVPEFVWPIIWILAVGLMVVYVSSKSEVFGDWVGFVYIAGMLLISGVTLSISNWFTLRNKDNG